MTDKKPNPFILIKHAGEPSKAEFEGVTVTRQKELYTDEWGLIPCTHYDNHFVFEVPKSRIRPGMWEHFCTCGSHAVIAIPANIFVCFFYHSRLLEDGHGYHVPINKKDFPNIAGQTIKISEPPKWLI